MIENVEMRCKRRMDAMDERDGENVLRLERWKNEINLRMNGIEVAIIDFNVFILKRLNEIERQIVETRLNDVDIWKAKMKKVHTIQEEAQRLYYLGVRSPRYIAITEVLNILEG